MFYLVKYMVKVGKKIEFHNSLFLHLTLSSARKEAESKQFYGMYPVLDFCIDTLILNEDM